MSVDSVQSAPTPDSRRTPAVSGDREVTAQRLLRSTADRAYDAEVDIDWDAPLDPEKLWLTEHRVSLYGTRLWDKLTPEQRLTLGKHEMVAILSYGIMAEVGLSTNLLRGVFANDNLADPFTQYALSEVGEETRHSTMFGRLINKSGLRPYTRPSFAAKIMRPLGFMPLGPAMHAGTLLIEEMLDRLQREAMGDETVQPHVRQMNMIHVLEEARHITYARNELVQSIAERGRIGNAYHRVLFAAMVLLVMPSLINPLVYKSVGIKPMRGFIAAQTSPRYRENAVFMLGPLLTFLNEAGMVRGWLTTRLLKASRALPDEVLADIEARRHH